MIAGDATRGAVKFSLIAGITVFYLVCLAVAYPGPLKIFSWTVATGVCIRLLWPTQDEGDAMINKSRDDGA